MNGKNAGEYIVKNSFLKSYQLYAIKEYGNTIVSKEFEVEDIIKELDEFEFEYYPTGNYMGGNNKRLVTVFSEENYKSIYVGKFDDMDMSKVLKKAWEQGVHCFVVFGKCNEFDNL